jgi:hypothetical protein
MPAPGWPTAQELAARLGLTAGEDVDNVTVALEAARADAVYFGGPAGTVDPDAGMTDAAVYTAVLDLGVNWYQSRNRPSDFATQGPFAVNVPSRFRAIAVVTRGKVSIA